MKGWILVGLALLVLAVTVMSGSAYHEGTYDNFPKVDPVYEKYFDGHDFFNDNDFRKNLKLWHYDNVRSPYVTVGYPYGKRPWFKPYGEGYPRLQPQQAYNPFYGFPYLRFYHCHSTNACHYHNVFPDS